LKTLSVGSVEELFGLISSAPEATASYLGLASLAQLQAQLAPRTSEFLEAAANRTTPPKALGALPPPKAKVFAQAPDFRRAASSRRTKAASAAPKVGPPTLLPGLMNPIRSQGVRGTCVAFAVTAVFEYALGVKFETSIDLSEQFLYWSAKGRDGDPEAPGTLVEVAMKCLADTGQCLEESWPYNPVPVAGSEGQGPAPAAAVSDAVGRKASGSMLNANDVSAIIKTIDAGRPVALTVPVYQNWIDNEALDEYGFFPLPLATTKIRGGHAMCVVGYGADADTPGGGYLVMRNSWSTDWAPSSPIAPGHGTLPFEYVQRLAWEAATI
jgi:hypothetical protein